ncbi:50S ribosomal protein L11 methyltransferase [Nesterenkonia pannonica]|uniref:50S ribosomal protein L11 methyltransferase n=1 Tax=Nesterenkonia pannonica TaxID=1548602 RepID=UPI0021641BE4|nr:50S ribosomal protein L11 methyltransferase [Nesterenkonia pannonica]
MLGIGQASLTLAASTHRRQVATALDIGTGCGIQLLHLLLHADHVVGTDLSERALTCARFNLLLNAPTLRLDPQNLHSRVELLHGSLLEPVAGRRFDLVVSNPRSSSPSHRCPG